MAITKLMHIGEDDIFPSCHLRNSIYYILDVKHDGEKTEYGLWVGGNVGTEAEEVYQKFMETKKAWGKKYGRQGYHFIISFAPGETDEATCCDVLRKFCEEYLGDNYEYVYAVHNDKDHIHGHIIFNSVNRINGYKYRYQNGDWAKFIQPITDKITQEEGLVPLVFTEDKAGVAYAQWASEKKGKLNWTDIIRADVDMAIKNSSSLEEFFEFMDGMNYRIRTGRSRKNGGEEIYLTFYYTDENGVEHRRRNYKLLPGTKEYSLENIKAKIEDKSKMKEPHYEKVALILERKTSIYIGMKKYMQGYKTYSRLYQAVGYYRLPNPFAVPNYRVRNDILHIENLIQECEYIKRNHIKNMDELERRAEKLDENLKSYYVRRKALKRMEEDFRLLVPAEMSHKYFNLKRKYEAASDGDDMREVLEDEIKDVEMELPAAYINNAEELLACEAKIKVLKNEKKVLGRVLNMEGGRTAAAAKEMIMPRILKK